jgi:hypothetical protein
MAVMDSVHDDSEVGYHMCDHFGTVCTVIV